MPSLTLNDILAEGISRAQEFVVGVQTPLKAPSFAMPLIWPLGPPYFEYQPWAAQVYNL
jgi:hypothetical protein